MQLRVHLEPLIFSAVIIELVLMDLALNIFIGIFNDLFTFRKKRQNFFIDNFEKNLIFFKNSIYAFN